MKLTKRKVLYLIGACIALGLGIITVSKLFPPVRHSHGFKIVSEDGVAGGGLGEGGRGTSASMKTWESSNGVKVYESRVAYSSEEDALRDFEAARKSAETIIEQQEGLLPSDVDKSFVATFIRPESRERTFRVIRLKGTEIYHAEAPSLEYALAFK